MKITGTKRIKGALTIPTLKLELIAGSTRIISNDDFKNPDLQAAINMGWVEYEPDGMTASKSKDEEVVEDRHVTIKNIHTRPLLLEKFGWELAPGKTMQIKESDLGERSVYTALHQNLLEMVNIETDEEELTETTVSAMNVFDEKEKEEEEEEEVPFTDEKSEEKENNQEAKISSVIDEENPPAVNPKDYPDPKKKSVVWNPTGEKILHEMEKTTVWEGSPGKMRTTGKSEDKKTETSKKSDEIRFVDQEQEQEKIQSHPVLKENTVSDKDLDFIS